MTKVDYKVGAFRAKYEQDLRKLVTLGCCVASCTNDGNAEQEEFEMNDFAGKVLALVERVKRTQRRRSTEETNPPAKVTALRA